jgi:hypothetical protein
MPQTVPELRELIAPVERVRHDPPVLQPEQDGIALCLPGGGYRPCCFHVGAIIRLNELGCSLSVAATRKAPKGPQLAKLPSGLSAGPLFYEYVIS